MTYSTDHPPGIPASAPAPCLPLATWAADDGVALSRPGSSLLLDCSALPYQRTLGVCHQVSQLLQLRRTGVSISLYRANPVLCRCLQQLQVAHLFTWVA